MTNDELKHYGILGMKWGRRRDKKRINNNRTLHRKKNNVKSMTDAALSKEIRRLTEEKKYLELANYVDNAAPSLPAKVKKSLKSLGLFTSKTLYTQAVSQGTKIGFQQLSKKLTQSVT